MAKTKFVHLHVHSDYSVFDGVARVQELVEKARELGMPAIALTDHGHMMGAVDFYRAAREAGLKPIIGMEAYVATGPRTRKHPELDKGRYHLTLLALDERGYRNLMFLASMAYLEGFYYKPRVDKELLGERSEGLVALSGCPQGEIPFKFVNQSPEEAERALREYLEIFGTENFYLELQQVGVPGYDEVNAFLVEMARKYGLRLVATNDVHYINPGDHRLQDILIKASSNRTDDEPYIHTQDLWLKPPEVMAELFKDVPEAVEETVRLAERAQLELEVDAGRLHLPKFPIPEGLGDEHAYLEKLAWEGLRRKFPDGVPEEYEHRLRYELSVIKETGFSGYFLIIWDIVKTAKERGIPVGPGRGSGAGSLVLHTLGITELDPIKTGLIFERFLNPERVSPPDVDIDFADNRRDEVIEFIRQRYGADSVAQIITYSRLKARAAVKDTARVLGIPFQETNRVTSLVPPTASLTEAVQLPEIKRLLEEDERWKEVFSIAARLEGRLRNPSVHAAGIVITPGKLWEYVPLAVLNSSAGNQTVVTQYDMAALEALGILKVDILGLRTLSVVKGCLEQIEKRRGEKLNLRKIPLDDPKTFSLLAKGDTGSVFQLESAGMRRVLRELKPSHIEDIFAVVALYRTGPLEAGMVEHYIARKQGREPVEYPFPELEPVLKDTYGVIVYQEQVMQIAMVLAGFTAGQADVLRKAVGKKKPELMAKMKDLFIEGAVARGHDRKKVEELWEAIEEFAGYSFNRAHAASYGLLAYWTAFLKANYPTEFMTAALNAATESGKASDKVPPLIEEARKMGITVLPPDINRSEALFTIVDEGVILYGFEAIKNVGGAAVEDILKARALGGPFASLEDFVARVSNRVNKRVLESLIKAGAFDSINPDRRGLLEKAERLVSSGSKGGTFTGGLFAGMMPVKEDKGKPDPQFNASAEKEVLGIYLSASPLDQVPEARLVAAVRTNELEEHEGERVRVVGVLLGLRRQKSKRGSYFATGLVEDWEGRVPILIFQDALNRVGGVLEEGRVYAFEGRVLVEEAEGEEGEEATEVKILLDDAVPIEKLLKERKAVLISLYEEELGAEIVSQLKEELNEALDPKGLPVYFKVVGSGVRFFKNGKLKVSPKAVKRLAERLGEGRVGFL